MKNENKQKYVLFIFALCMIGGMIYFTLAHIAFHDRKEYKEALEDYSVYMTHRDDNDTISRLTHSYLYYKNINTSFEDKSYMKKLKRFVKKDINKSLESALNLSTLNARDFGEIDKVMKENFITESNRKLYDVRKSEVERKISRFSATTEQTFELRQSDDRLISLGMSEKEVLETLGEPREYKTDESESGIYEVLEYGNIIMYLLNDEVKRIVY